MIPHTIPIGFLGAGQMATALAKGWLGSGLLDAERSTAADPYAAATQLFRTKTGLTTAASNRDVLTQTDVLVLAVKPQILPNLLEEIRPHLEPRHLLISIAAGVQIREFEARLGSQTRIVRVMPNTPALLGASAAGYSANAAATADDLALVGRLFSAVGVAYALPEGQLDAVTGLSGSGPAFVYVLIEAMADGGVRMGLPREVALKLAAQTVLGSARMVLETGQHPGQLKDAVASPGGTTIAGLHALERGGLRASIMDAIEAATLRATELGRK